MVEITWTEFAMEDLRSIHEYISKVSKVYPDRQVDKIIKRVDQLEISQEQVE
ncbi:MAG: hypothetical protein JWP81_3946 [Ferruginibacter sp.]|nr:hypothetical protein [Ferruginibacter sp.]